MWVRSTPRMASSTGSRLKEAEGTAEVGGASSRQPAVPASLWPLPASVVGSRGQVLDRARPDRSGLPVVCPRQAKGRVAIRGTVEYNYTDVTEVSLDRETRRLEVVTDGKRVVVEGIDRLYVRSVPWSEADGTVRLTRGRVSVNGNVAAVVG